MKREVPIAQFFFPLEAPCAYAANRKAHAPNPSPALHLTTQPRNAELCNEIHFQLACHMVQSYTHVPLIYDKC